MQIIRKLKELIESIRCDEYLILGHEHGSEFQLFYANSLEKPDLPVYRRFRASSLDVAIAYHKVIMDNLPQMCPLPPKGWYCTRPVGHDGPCACYEESYLRGVENDRYRKSRGGSI